LALIGLGYPGDACTLYTLVESQVPQKLYNIFKQAEIFLNFFLFYFFVKENEASFEIFENNLIAKMESSK
jgi:hypothetical protein